MNRQGIFSAIIFLAFLTVLLMAISCTGNQETDSDDPASQDDQGRVIVPDGNWEQAEGDDDEWGDDDPESGGSGKKDNTPNGYSTRPETNPPPSTGNGDDDEPVAPEERVTLEIFVNGILHPADMPIGVHDGETIYCEFRVNSALSPLAYFYITNSAAVSIPSEGEVFGKEAILPYTFTFVSNTWGDDGIITLTVNLSNGMPTSWEIPVFQIGMDDRIIY